LPKIHSMKYVTVLLVLLVQGIAISQINIQVHEAPNIQLPGVQSFAFGTQQGEWLILGGRVDGLHRRQPWASFQPEDNNTRLMVVNPVTGQFWSAALDSFPLPLQEQLQSTNMNFTQVGDHLFLAGGYGYAPSAGDHVTHPYLTALRVPDVITAVKTGLNPAGPFRYVADDRFRVTGGQMHHLDGWFYLMGGQQFMGRYNPMGPTHGPGFVQKYTDAIRKFTVQNTPDGLQTGSFSEWVDSLQLHRRDFNALPQMFPDGTRGFTMFSGVFRPDADLPWLNTVDVRPNGYADREGFNQLLNQYHTAHVALYDQVEGAMYAVFFGGISRYQLNPAGDLVDDPNVPFVRTISVVERGPDGAMREYKIGEMPDWLGAGAEFIPAVAEDQGIIMLNDLPQADSILIGYVYGGIQSVAPNIFFTNEGDQSLASGRVFEVWWYPSAVVSVQLPPVRLPDRNRLRVYPNPASGAAQAAFEAPVEERLRLVIYDQQGAVVRTVFNEVLAVGQYIYPIDMTGFPAGTYYFRLCNANGICSEVQVVR